VVVPRRYHVVAPVIMISPSAALIVPFEGQELLFVGELTKSPQFFLIQLPASPPLARFEFLRGEVLESAPRPRRRTERSADLFMVPYIPNSHSKYTTIYQWLRTLYPGTRIWVYGPEERFHLGWPVIKWQGAVGSWLDWLDSLEPRRP
jgi:hypothetical protein